MNANPDAPGGFAAPIGSAFTCDDLLKAKNVGVWCLRRQAEFYLRRWDNDELKRPGMVLKAGTIVHIEKVYRSGRAALLCYIDRSGKPWWSWTHATPNTQAEGRSRKEPNV